MNTAFRTAREDVVYAVPNNCKGELLNGEDMPGRVVLVERGEVSGKPYSKRFNRYMLVGRSEV